MYKYKVFKNISELKNSNNIINIDNLITIFNDKSLINAFEKYIFNKCDNSNLYIHI